LEKNNPERSLGIDPGLNITGIGIIDIINKKPTLVHFDHIKTSARLQLHERLYKINRALDGFLKEYKPDRVAIEDIFYADNVKTAIVMGHARGAAIIAAMENGATVKAYAPREVKKSVVGNGAATKAQVKFMVARFLQIKENISPDDASDALAVAICAWNRMTLEKQGLK